VINQFSLKLDINQQSSLCTGKGNRMLVFTVGYINILAGNPFSLKSWVTYLLLSSLLAKDLLDSLKYLKKWHALSFSVDTNQHDTKKSMGKHHM
jgi:hypothetical protein